MAKITLSEVNNDKQIEILTEEYMEANWDSLDKDEVSLYQNMSIRFLLRHEDDINWKLYSANPFITMEAIEFFKAKLGIE